MNKTPLNFIKEMGLFDDYKTWRGYVPPINRKEYYHLRYLKKKEQALQLMIDAKRNPQ